MMHGPGIVTLLDNGMLYEGWESVQITRSVKQMAGQFSLKVSERWTGGADGPASLLGWRIRPGDACVVAYDGLPVVTGYVDAYNPKYSATSHEVMIQGRSKTGDLCDCSAEADVPTGEQRDVTLDQVARKVASKYGIGVKVRADTREKFDVVRVQPGETVHELLERYARPGSVALTDDEQGNLVLLHVEDASGPALIEGVNILEASAVLRADNRYRDYEVKGQDHGTNGEYGRPVAQRSAKAQDGAVKRHRPFRMLNETKTGRQHSKSRAAWEASARAGESVRVEVKVVGWTSAPGKLWTPGETATVVSPMLALERSLAIETVRFSQDQSGTIATLSLVPPEALNPKSGGGAKGGKSDGQWTATKPAAAPVVTNPMPGILVQR